VFNELSAELEQYLEKLNQILGSDLPKVNQLMKRARKKEIVKISREKKINKLI
jgi:hypothetical protein